MKLQLDRLGTIGFLITAIASPCCFPLFGFLLSALGFGSFELFGGWTMWVFQGFVLLSLVGTYLSYRKHRRPAALLIAIISAALVLYSYHFVDAEYWTALLYAGMAGLMISAAVNYFHTKRQATVNMQLQSTITCPVCGHQKQETMPTDACVYFYECESCHTRLKPAQGDCCVYCSYGNVKCPPVQSGAGCC